MSTVRDRSKPLRTAESDGLRLESMAHPSPKVALAGRHMAHRTRRGPLQFLAGLLRAISPSTRSNRPEPIVSRDPLTPGGSTDSALGADAPAHAGSAAYSGTGEIARLRRKHGAIAAERARTPDLPADGSAGRRLSVGRRLLGREPHRRELAAVLVLLLIACTLSASLPGAWAAHPGSFTPSAQPVANLDPSGPADYFLEPAGNPSPTPTDVPTYTVPPLSEGSAEIGPTEAPTTTPTKAPPTKPPPSKKYTFVALGDSLTYGYGDPGPAWPVRLDAKDAQLTLVHNAGVSGDTTAGMRARLNSDVFAYKPDMLFVMGGTNDIGHEINISTTIGNLKAIIVSARAKGIRVILMTIPPTSYPHMTDSIDTLNAQIIYVGNIYGLVVADIHTPLSAPGGLYNPKYTSDGLHFSTLGTQVVANTIFNRCQAARF
ncbi:MAG: SGNH/GDSL hydrolase family protein [Candidatus Limnocylindrales bacterium]